jgi:hypothetical protein
MPMPSASATVSWARIARQVKAQQQGQRRRGEQDEIPSAPVADRNAGELRRIDHDPGGEAAPSLVLAAQIDHHEMQRQCADRQIEPAQAQRRQSEDDTEHAAHERGRRQGDPERRVRFPEQDPDRERAGRHQAGVPERDQAGVAGEQHQGQRTDAGEKNLAGEVELKRRGDEREAKQRDHEQAQADALEARPGQGEILRIVGAEIAAGARLPRHGRAPPGCRTGPRAARSAWR